MRLSRAASFFDKTVCRDAYGVSTFKGQFGLYDDATRDGLGSVRRVLSTAPTVTPPARHAILVEGVNWLVGDQHQDFFGALAIRHKHVLHKAGDLAWIRSFAQCIAGAGGTQAYAARVWIKTSKQVEVSSNLFDVFELIFGAGEPVATSSIVEMNGSFYLVESAYPTEAGFLAATAIELPSPRVDMAVTSRNYQPATDTWAETPAYVTGLSVRWQDHFKYFACYSEKYEPGDLQVLVRKADVAPLKAGDQVLMGTQQYRVVAAYDEEPIWSCHVRPA